MKVDLPTPGTPLMPILRAVPEYGSSAVRSRWASSRWSALVDSTRVMARATAEREPPSTPLV